MDSYLMMLYVTLDQESALKSFFIDQGWNFLKPDLTVITDKIGPVNSLSTQCRTPAQATFPVETDKVSPVPENTIHVEISGKHNPKPSNSRKRQANSKQTKHPVAKVPKLTLNLSTRIRSANSSEKSQPEFLVQIQDDNIEPDFANIVHEVTVKEEPVDTDSDIGPECDDVDDNESTDEAEESHEVSAGNGVNNASDRKNVTEGNGEQDKEETNKDLAKPKRSRKSATGRYRSYSLSALTEAYYAVKEGNMAVTRAAKLFGVPEQTLRDRVHGKVEISRFTSGTLTVLTLEEETKVVKHLKTMSSYGYQYTRQDVCDIATDYAVQLGKRTADTPFTLNWFDLFHKRWPDLKLRTPRPLGKSRAKCASVETISSYFDELQQLLRKYNIEDKPDLIFNVAAHVITSGKTQTTTVLGCGSASGIALPPFFIFTGKKMVPDFMKGASPGAAGAVSETGCSNALIFRQYLKDHFIKFVPRTELDQHILVLLDGHTSNVSVDLLAWAKEKRIILFVFPAYTPYILQPLNVACYGLFETMFNSECEQLKRQTSTAITKHNICELLCRVYSSALSSENLHTAFSKTGIFPFSRDVISEASVRPSEVFHASKVATEAIGTDPYDSD